MFVRIEGAKPEEENIQFLGDVVLSNSIQLGY
jgi:hypothetical protein